MFPFPGRSNAQPESQSPARPRKLAQQAVRTTLASSWLLVYSGRVEDRFLSSAAPKTLQHYTRAHKLHPRIHNPEPRPLRIPLRTRPRIRNSHGKFAAILGAPHQSLRQQRPLRPALPESRKSTCARHHCNSIVYIQTGAPRQLSINYGKQTTPRRAIEKAFPDVQQRLRHRPPIGEALHHNASKTLRLALLRNTDRNTCRRRRERLFPMKFTD